ncbi:MAG: tetratricopeptide (TPR) repeat protein [Candidatus Azotimanducaceae bacterium]
MVLAWISNLIHLKHTLMIRHFVFVIALLTSTFICQSSANETTLDQALDHFDAGHYELALRGFESIRDKNNPDITYYLARSYFHEGRLEPAMALFRENVGRFPNHAKSHFLLGSVSLTMVAGASIFKKFGLAKSALTSWHRAVDLENDNVEAIYGLASFYLNAPSIAGGDNEKAQIQIDRLSSLSMPYTKLIIAAKKSKAGEKETAEQLIIGAIKEIPDRAFPVLILADYYFKEGRFKDALDQTENYQSRKKTWNDPGIAQTALLTGRIHKGLGNIDKAKVEFNKAINALTHEHIKKLAIKELKTI